MIEVPLVELEVILRYSLAIRQESAPADELLAVLDASRALVEDLMRQAGSDPSGAAPAGSEPTAQMARVDLTDDDFDDDDSYAAVPTPASAGIPRRTQRSAPETPAAGQAPARSLRRARATAAQADPSQPAGDAELWATGAGDDDLGHPEPASADQGAWYGDGDDPDDLPADGEGGYGDLNDGGYGDPAADDDYADVPPAPPARSADRPAPRTTPARTAPVRATSAAPADEELPPRPARARRPDSRQRPLRASDP